MAITTGRKQEGAQSATYFFEAAGSLGDTVIEGVNTDWDGLSSGKLKDVLNRVYAEVDGDPALKVFSAAWAAAGGSVSISQFDASEAAYFQWSLSVAGYPVLNYTVGDAAGIALRIAVSYSASE